MDEKDWPATVALPGVVSEGTLNPFDLVPVYVDLLRKIDESELHNNTNWCVPCLTSKGLGEYGALKQDELLSEIMVEMADKLNALAPEGYYFGGVEGDPACIGFFEDPDYVPDELECLNCTTRFVAHKGYGLYCSEECASENPPDHVCVQQETPDGRRCVTCTYH